jgi:hypothetical protein
MDNPFGYSTEGTFDRPPLTRELGRVVNDVIERTPSTIRGELLDEAKLLIEGDRNKTYGSPTQNFQNTAELFTTLLRHKLKDGEVIQPHEVATLMIALKLARTIAEPKRDNFVDIAGYAACGYETLEELRS